MKDNGFIKFQGKIPLVVIGSIVSAIIGVYVQIAQMREKQENQAKKIETLEKYCDCLKDRLPRIEEKLGAICANLEDIKTDLKERTEKRK